MVFAEPEFPQQDNQPNHGYEVNQWNDETYQNQQPEWIQGKRLEESDIPNDAHDEIRNQKYQLHR